jgi:hypothetical protein
VGPGVSEVREAGNVSEKTGVGRGLIVGLGRIVAPGLFHIFFSSFSFSVFLILLYYLQKNASNQFKPLLEIF